MEAAAFHDIVDVHLDGVPGRRIEHPTDAIVRLASSAIRGAGPRFVLCGTSAGAKPGAIPGHEGVGVVEEVGRGVRNPGRGDRAAVPSAIPCGNRSRSGHTARRSDADPEGPTAGTAFHGGPADTGPFDGLRAEFGRMPFAHRNPVRAEPCERFDLRQPDGIKAERRPGW